MHLMKTNFSPIWIRSLKGNNYNSYFLSLGHFFFKNELYWDTSVSVKRTCILESE